MHHPDTATAHPAASAGMAAAPPLGGKSASQYKTAQCNLEKGSHESDPLFGGYSWQRAVTIARSPKQSRVTIKVPMVYTCFQMIADCRADRPDGWRHFASAYVPVIRWLLAHYDPSAGDIDARTEHLLVDLRRADSPLFTSLEPSPERWFVAQLRQEVVGSLPLPQPDYRLDLAIVAEALETLTVTEKMAAWFEGMRYDAAGAAELMRIAPATVQKIRSKAADLVRGKVDAWNQTLMTENGLPLGREAYAAQGNDCLPAKTFLDILDGRTTWSGREAMERHVNGCWHCIDHYARMEEVIGLMRSCKPLSESDAARYRKVLGVSDERRPVWKRFLGAK